MLLYGLAPDVVLCDRWVDSEIGLCAWLVEQVSAAVSVR